MTIGMLWFDNSKDDLTEKVLRAINYYKKKYGEQPTRCYIHPTLFNLSGQIRKVGEVEIYVSRQVLPNHFWLGVEDRI